MLRPCRVNTGALIVAEQGKTNPHRLKPSRLARANAKTRKDAAVQKNSLRPVTLRYKVILVMTEHGAEEHLRAIRLLMERATIYRAISAPTALVGGLLSSGLAAAMLVWQAGDGSRNVDAHQYYDAWLLVLLVTLAANTFFIWRGAHRRGEPLVSAGFRLALRSVFPAFFAGIAMSGILTVSTGISLFPTLMWVVFYGLGLLATMSFAPRSIVVLGWAFLFTGIVAFIYLLFETYVPHLELPLLPDVDLPTPTRFYPAAIMGATFGLYHLAYAACTWPRRTLELDAAERRPLVTENFPPVP